LCKDHTTSYQSATRSSDTTILSFENEAEYSKFIRNIKAIQSHKNKFASVQDVYSEEMYEMENNVGETKESYLNFK